MLSHNDIMSTIDMIDHQHLDIRTITLGLSLLDCADPDPKACARKIYDKICRSASRLVPTGEAIERELGIPIVNKRISVTPIALVAAACETEDFTPFAQAMDRAAREVGVNFIGGFSALVHKGMTSGGRRLIASIPEALAATELERLCDAMQRKTGLRPQTAAVRSPEPESSTTTTDNGLFTDEMLAQLHTVFDRMAAPLRLRLCLDERPMSTELKAYMDALAVQTDKLSVEDGDPSEADHLPCVQVCRADGSWTGLAFHGVPGGHEFTSFVLGLYNAAGPGQALDEETRKAIQTMKRPVDLQVLVSLSCTMCPERVTAAQRLAAECPNITAQVYDLNHYPDLRERFQVMSIPCLVVNGGEQISFGKKNLRQLLELLIP